MKAYLFPGQGADERMFKNLHLPAHFEVILIKWEMPAKADNLSSFARKMAQQVDTTEQFVLIGASLGGMLITEMCDFMSPQKAIIISSAKCQAELPKRYRFMQNFPLNRLLPGVVYKYGSFLAQPIVEPDRKKEKATCVAMLKAKKPKFLKRTANMIINWNRTTFHPNIIHIHGDVDRTIPIKNVKYDHLIKNGSHMMTLTEGKKVSQILEKILENLK